MILEFLPFVREASPDRETKAVGHVIGALGERRPRLDFLVEIETKILR